MTDTNQSEGKEEDVPASQEQEPVPTPEETPQETQPQEEVTEEKQEETTVAETPQEGLPDDASERTKKEFEKLKGQLSDERAKNTRGNSVFDSLRGPQPQEQVQPQAQPVEQPNPFTQQPQPEEPLVDAEGTVDIDRVNQGFEQAKKAEERVLQAEQRFLRIEEDRQTQEAIQAHPELDPQGNDFDSDLFDMVSAVAAKNMLEGGTQTIKQITDNIKDKFTPTPKEVNKVKKEAVENFKESQEKKEDQAPIETGKGANRQTDSIEDLKNRTRAGDGDALTQRLENIGM